MSSGFIPRRPGGNDPEALFAQAVWDELWGGGARFNPSKGGKTIRTTRGTHYIPEEVEQDSIDSTPSGQQRFRVKEVHGDYLTCRTWDGTTEGSADVYVAKLPELRRSWGGTPGGEGGTEKWVDGADLTYTYQTRAGTEDKQRTSTDGTTTIIEIVVPVYHCNNHADGYTEIYAIQPEGGTGVTVGGNPVVWIDPTYRFWGRVPS